MRSSSRRARINWLILMRDEARYARMSAPCAADRHQERGSVHRLAATGTVPCGRPFLGGREPSRLLADSQPASKRASQPKCYHLMKIISRPTNKQLDKPRRGRQSGPARQLFGLQSGQPAWPWRWAIFLRLSSSRSLDRSASLAAPLGLGRNSIVSTKERSRSPISSSQPFRFLLPRLQNDHRRLVALRFHTMSGEYIKGAGEPPERPSSGRLSRRSEGRAQRHQSSTRKDGIGERLQRAARPETKLTSRAEVGPLRTDQSRRPPEDVRAADHFHSHSNTTPRWGAIKAEACVKAGWLAGWLSQRVARPRFRKHDVRRGCGP